MTRFLSSSAQAASEASQLNFRVLADIAVQSSTMYAITGFTYVTVGANTYSPIGHLGGFDEVREESDVFPRAVRLWLSAVGTGNLSEPLSENLFNKSVTLYRSYVDVNSPGTLVSTPEMIFRGRINRGELKLGDPERGNYYEIEVETRLRRNGASVYFTRETLQSVLVQSSDVFFDYLSDVSRTTAKWGIGGVVEHEPKRGSIPRGRREEP